MQGIRVLRAMMVAPNGSERGPVALPVFKIGRSLLSGGAGFDSQALPPFQPVQYGLAI